MSRYETDYILRMIAEFGQQWAYLLGQLRSSDDGHTLVTVDEICQGQLGVPLHFVLHASEDALLARMRAIDAAEGYAARIGLAALLMAASTSYQQQHDRDAARLCRVKALHLMLAVLTQHPDLPLPAYAPDVESLISSVSDEPLPAATATLLIRHYEQQGAYAKAEDLLFFLLEDEATPQRILQGIAFYERLLTLDDATLEAGALPRIEIEAARAELRSNLLNDSSTHHQ